MLYSRDIMFCEKHTLVLYAMNVEQYENKRKSNINLNIQICKLDRNC